MTGTEKQLIYSNLSLINSWLNGTEKKDCSHLVFSDDQRAGETSIPEPEAAIKPLLSIDAVTSAIASCTKCSLAKTRTNTVPGIGATKPLVLVIGEGPGAEEDAQGEPFVGPAGQLLDKMLDSICLSRDKNCYIANIVKCRPPHNRDPLPEEAEACRSFLIAQIELLKPAYILTVGRIATQNLLNTTDPIGKMRGHFFDFSGIPVLPTYHPSALLREENLKRPAWEDLKLLRQKLLQEFPNYMQKYRAETTE